MIEEFIKRRFSVDCNWMNGNCYYFSLILKDRFPGGTIYYDVIYGHFMYGINGKFYDWTGETIPKGQLVEWAKMDKYDSLVRQRVYEGCIG